VRRPSLRLVRGRTSLRVGAASRERRASSAAVCAAARARATRASLSSSLSVDVSPSPGRVRAQVAAVLNTADGSVSARAVVRKSFFPKARAQRSPLSSFPRTR